MTMALLLFAACILHVAEPARIVSVAAGGLEQSTESSFPCRNFAAPVTFGLMDSGSDGADGVRTISDSPVTGCVKRCAADRACSLYRCTWASSSVERDTICGLPLLCNTRRTDIASSN